MDISSELVAILGVGVALAGLMLAGQQRTDKRMDRHEDRLIAVENRLTAVETGQARMEGKLGFLENYILGRNAAPDGPAEAPAE